MMKGIPGWDPKKTTLLEEPRAELTSMFTLLLLYKKKMITLDHLKIQQQVFMMDAVRYFAKWGSTPMEPYIIFHIYSWNKYEELGLLTLTSDNRLKIDESKIVPCLEAFSAKFLEVLD